MIIKEFFWVTKDQFINSKELFRSKLYGQSFNLIAHPPLVSGFADKRVENMVKIW